MNDNELEFSNTNNNNPVKDASLDNHTQNAKKRYIGLEPHETHQLASRINK